MPVAMETMCVWGPGFIEFVKDLGGRLAVHLCEPQAFSHLRQGLDIAIQKGQSRSAVLFQFILFYFIFLYFFSVDKSPERNCIKINTMRQRT